MKTVTIALSIAFAVSAAACSGMPSTGSGIMRADSSDPVGSANIGTGSVTTNSTIPPEAKAAGMGLAP